MTNAEILKRYTTATMGPCQGAMCGRHLAAFVRDRVGASTVGARPHDARARLRAPCTLEDLAGGVHEVIEKRTALHEVHVAARRPDGLVRRMEAPLSYGDAREEYRAVRERVSVMDVGTLGKFLVAGPDAATLVDRVFPCRTTDLGRRARRATCSPRRGRVRDGRRPAVCAIEDGTLLPDLHVRRRGPDGGAAARTGRTGWDLQVHIVNQTAMFGAINVAGPHARDLLERLTDDRSTRPRAPVRRATPRSPSPACRAARSAPGSSASSRSSCTTLARGAWSCGTR